MAREIKDAGSLVAGLFEVALAIASLMLAEAYVFGTVPSLAPC
jgi:hypothetical protein